MSDIILFSIPYPILTGPAPFYWYRSPHLRKLVKAYCGSEGKAAGAEGNDGLASGLGRKGGEEWQRESHFFFASLIVLYYCL